MCYVHLSDLQTKLRHEVGHMMLEEDRRRARGGRGWRELCNQPGLRNVSTRCQLCAALS